MKPKVQIYIGLIILILFQIGNFRAAAQGVIHLGAGDSYLFTQPTFVRGFLDETANTFVFISLGFNGDLFTSGDSLQVDVFSTPTSLLPLATASATNPPWTTTGMTSFQWDGLIWGAPSGAVRVTMLSGSVDIASAQTITEHNQNNRTYSYSVPEPSVSLLLAPGLLYLFLCNRKPSTIPPSSR